ncbi:hypothetical protein HRG_013665 [Hirsutella rhossiliensis]
MNNPAVGATTSVSQETGPFQELGITEREHSVWFLDKSVGEERWDTLPVYRLLKKPLRPQYASFFIPRKQDEIGKIQENAPPSLVFRFNFQDNVRWEIGNIDEGHIVVWISFQVEDPNLRAASKSISDSKRKTKNGTSHREQDRNVHASSKSRGKRKRNASPDAIDTPHRVKKERIEVDQFESSPLPDLMDLASDSIPGDGIAWIASLNHQILDCVEQSESQLRGLRGLLALTVVNMLFGDNDKVLWPVLPFLRIILCGLHEGVVVYRWINDSW